MGKFNNKIKVVPFLSTLEEGCLCETTRTSLKSGCMCVRVSVLCADEEDGGEEPEMNDCNFLDGQFQAPISFRNRLK